METEQTSVQQSDQAYYSAARIQARAIWDAIATLEAMQARWTALDSGTTMGDGQGTNYGLTAADVGAVVFATADAMRALLDTGHATNLAKLL